MLYFLSILYLIINQEGNHKGIKERIYVMKRRKKKRRKMKREKKNRKNNKIIKKIKKRSLRVAHISVRNNNNNSRLVKLSNPMMMQIVI